jgi:hypothetical protein
MREDRTMKTSNRPSSRERAKKGLWAAVLAAAMLTSSAYAGEAATSASAGSSGRGPGMATATAQYTGDGRGFAETRTRSGPISMGRGVAYGMDEHGFTFSVSNAVAGRYGPAVASNFNFSIGFDGSVATSGGTSVARGSPARTAGAGGFARSVGGGPSAGATATGHTGPTGVVRATTYSRTIVVRHAVR